MRVPLLTLGLCIGLCPPHWIEAVGRPPAALAGPAAPEPLAVADAAKRLTVYVQRLKRFKDDDQAVVLAELRQLLDDVGEQREQRPATRAACDLAALDVAAHGWLPQPEREALVRSLERPPGRNGAPPVVETLERRVSLLGLAHLRERIEAKGGDEVVRWISAEVLARTREHGVERRRAACSLLIGLHAPIAQAPLFASASAEEDLLREEAFRALAGWNDPAVHRFVLNELERGHVSIPVVLEHLRAIRDGRGGSGGLGDAAAALLAQRIAALFDSQDWRDAIRAVRLSEAFDGLRAAPLLLDALDEWTLRLEQGTGTPRVQDEIVSALRGISGRSIPPKPERWRVWWRAVQDGRVELPPEGDGEGAVTQASFFGLRPVTDRVIFVIDRSRSMKAGFGTTGTSRYENAIDELCRFATKLGGDAGFGVTLFHSDAERWKPRLESADDSGVKAARRWLESKDPDGGTRLFAGLSVALGLDRQGGLDPEDVRADTVIVLCDGDTAEGPYWVEPWLERVNEKTQLVFHCVQIGGRGDGTLELLAERTGGDFVRIDG